MIARWKQDARSVGYSKLDRIEDIACRGPVTPDHSLHTKRIPVVLDNEPGPEMDAFRDAYHA